MKCQAVLREVFQQVFANPDLEIRPDMTPNDIDGWDSMAHVNLVAAIELRFKVKFGSKELRGVRTVGDLGRLIDGKLAQ
ncbi:MAG: acyl carrier protein [Deltaproteobacteria bacterium]|jgi:acyl carrier protein|nr:acyl carrier protein [Deltaproteobacteria bacterium]